MLDKLKDTTAYGAVARYLSETKFLRKCMDITLVIVLMFAYGFATGKIHLPEAWKPNPPTHTVEHTFKQSNQIQKIIDGEQYLNNYNFIGSFKFHNGIQGLDGFNFMKYSLTEYSTGMGIMVDPLEMQNLPIVINMPMVSSLVEGKCYSAKPNPKSPTYLTAMKMNLQSYTVCPIRSRQGQLVGFVAIGVNKPEAPLEEQVRKITNQIQIYQK